MTNIRKGVSVTLPLIINEENIDQDLSKFECGLQDLILLNPIGNVFENEDCFFDHVNGIIEDGDPTTQLEDLQNIARNNEKSGDDLKNNNSEFFNRLMPLFSQTCGQITNQEQFNIVRKKLQEAHKEILEGNNAKKVSGNNKEKNGVVSLPVLDNRRKDVRKKPYNERY